MTNTIDDATADSGFSLIEVLVAFAILSLGLVMLYGAFGLHLRSAAEVQLHQRTLVEATSHLDRLVAGANLDRESTDGTYDSGATWHLSTMPIALAEQPNTPTRAVRIRLEARDGRGRILLDLATIILVRGRP